MSALDGKNIVVVGGGRGIGRATALFLAREGARVAIADNGAQRDGEGRDDSVCDDVAREIALFGGSAIAVCTDARVPEQVTSLVARVKAEWGHVDGAFFCAGLSHERALLRTTDADLERVLSLHVGACLRFVREFGRVLVDQRQGGSLLLSAGSEGLFGAAQRGALAAASGAVIGLARTAALELRRHHVRLNVLVPTARTRLTKEWPLFASIRPDSLTPEHVARVAAYLLSDEAVAVQGETLGVAGGRVYSLRSAESPGVYFDGPPVELETLAERFHEAIRSH